MTRLIQFANNATSKLAANLSSSGTSITLTPGDGVKFPALSGGQVFYGTLVKASGAKEVVKITARSTDTLTIGTRAAEAVAGVQTALAFTAGDNFELRMTAGTLSSELDRLDAAAFLDVANKTADYTVVDADICKLLKVNTGSGNVTITLPQISTLTGSFEIQATKSTGDANTVTVTRAGTDTINGLNTYALSAQYQCVWLVADLTTNTWTAVTSASASNRVVDVFTGAGSAGPFTLSGDPGAKNNTDVFVGGVYQQKASYTVSGTDLTLGGVVGIGVKVEVLWSQPLAIGTPSDGTVTPAKLANGGYELGLRNRIVNGKMNIVQRGVSFAAIGTTAYSIDRWQHIVAGAGVSTASQQSDVPPGNEFQSSLRIAVTAADPSLAATDVYEIKQVIEGYNVRDLIGRDFILSFQVRSSKIGTHCVAFKNAGPDRTYVIEYTVNAANTWETKSVTVSGGLITAGTWDWTNGRGLQVVFALGAGATSHTTAAAWNAGNFSCTSSQVNCLDTVGNIFAITGVQLELGSVATPFEQRPYGMELALCQRYCQALVTTVDTISIWQSWAFPVEFRANPTVTGGGAGFTFAIPDRKMASFYQTSRSSQPLLLVAEL